MKNTRYELQCRGIRDSVWVKSSNDKMAKTLKNKIAFASIASVLTLSYRVYDKKTNTVIHPQVKKDKTMKTKPKYLSFSFRGQQYIVDQQGRINANGIDHFSDTWIFLGGSTHHWMNRIDVPLPVAFKNPKALENCLGWDRDHGTVRRWGGRYLGKLPRITGVSVTEKL